MSFLVGPLLYFFNSFSQHKPLQEKYAEANQAFFKALCENNVASMQGLIISNPQLLSDRMNPMGDRPLHSAIKLRKLEAFTFLVANSDLATLYQTNDSHQTPKDLAKSPLFDPSDNPYLSIISQQIYHLEQNIDLDQYCEEKLNAFCEALKKVTHTSELESFITDLYSETFYNNLMTQGKIERLRGLRKIVQLLEHGFDQPPEFLGNTQETALHVALNHRHFSIAEILVKKFGIKLLGTQNGFEETPLHLAISHGQINETTQFMIQQSDLKTLNLKDYAGKTPLQLSQECRHSTITAWIQQRLEQLETT